METLIYSVYKNEFGSIFYRNAEGKLHRTDGPAIEYSNGTKAWWVDGKRHRIDGPAVEYASGSKEWWVNDKLHRTDSPAFERADGTKEWWVDGHRHRIDGPAIERANGSKEFWINGKKLTKKEFLKRTTVQEFFMDEIALKLGIPVELLKIKK